MMTIRAWEGSTRVSDQVLGPSPPPLTLSREPKASLEGRNPPTQRSSPAKRGRDRRRRWRGKAHAPRVGSPPPPCFAWFPSPVAARRRRKALVRASRLATLAPQHEEICR